MSGITGLVRAALLRQRVELSTSQVAALMGRERNETRDALKNLEAMGEVRRVQAGNAHIEPTWEATSDMKRGASDLEALRLGAEALQKIIGAWTAARPHRFENPYATAD